MFRFGRAETFGKNDRTEIGNNRMSGNPIFRKCIVIGVEGLECSRVPGGVHALQVKMKKRPRMPLSGFTLMDVQERRFQEGDYESEVSQDANVTPHCIYTYTALYDGKSRN
jgi:hypothetical protein